jgi:hypothetical protein
MFWRGASNHSFFCDGVTLHSCLGIVASTDWVSLRMYSAADTGEDIGGGCDEDLDCDSSVAVGFGVGVGVDGDGDGDGGR